MKKYKYLLILLILPVLYFSCTDSGVLPQYKYTGEVILTLSNLKTLDKPTDGIYEAWVYIDSASILTYYLSLGRFNINSSGLPVDESGNLKVFSFNGDTNRLDYVKYCLVTLQQDSDASPSTKHLIAGSLTQVFDSLTGDLTMSDTGAFGTVGGTLLNGEGAMYVLRSPTDNNASCYKGAWFCNSSGNSPRIPPGLALPATSMWIYEGWVEDNVSHNFYSMGRFSNPYSGDLDGGGQCAGITGNPYNFPGQDWIQSGGGCPNITSLRSGQYGIFITIEPLVENALGAGKPFFLKIFYQSHIDPSLACGQEDNLFSQYASLPKGRIKIINP